jgi:KDO2-lipid IV(A) lauroyltransferase
VSTRLIHALLRGLAALVALLGWRRAGRLGGWLGLLWFHGLRIRRGVVFRNLALALPHRAAEHRRIARECYRQLGASALELLVLGSLSPAEVAARVRAEGLEHFEVAAARGRGVIVVTAHFGNFDLLACSQAARGVPLAIVSRELGRGGGNRFWMETRARSGLGILPAAGSGRALVRWLRQGKALGLVVDQRTGPRQGGVRVPFLGVPAWTTTAPAVLALATGAAIVPARIERGSGGEHTLVVEPEIPLPAGERERVVARVTEAVNEAVGRWVEGRPDHWLWLHRRFRDPSHKGEIGR